MYKINFFFRISRIPLAQCDPTEVEGRTVAVCLLPVLNCVQAAKSKQLLGSGLLHITDSERKKNKKQRRQKKEVENKGRG